MREGASIVEIYTLLKFVHVTAVIIWIGGVTAVSVLTARLSLEQDRAAAGVLLRQAGFFGQAVVLPAAVITLLAGAATAGSAGIPMSSLWITWGFAAIFGSILLGAIFIRRATGELGKLAASAQPDDARLIGVRRRLSTLNALNVLLLLSAVWAMVAKPAL
jgi:uncharacterized membrane protein